MNWKRVALGVLALVVLTTLGHDWSKPAHAATNRGWIGGTSGLWGIASNWSPAGVPQDGDVLIFHSAANGGATSITISAPQGNTTRIASITSDIRYLTIAGPVTITKSIFVETILDQVNIGSLYLDGDETELSMQSSRSVRGSIQVADQLRIRGSVNDHGGLVYAEHLVGSGSVVAKTGTFSARDTRDRKSVV